MKRLLIYLFLSLFFCSFAKANIIFKGCSLEPNYGSDAIFTINLDQKLIKVKDTYDLEERTRIFNIKKYYGNIITSSNITNSSETPDGGIEFLTQYVIDEVIFDLAKKTVSVNFSKKSNIPEGLSRILDEKEKAGRFKWNVSSTCNVENPYGTKPVEEEPKEVTKPEEKKPEDTTKPEEKEPEIAEKPKEIKSERKTEPVDESELIIIGSGSGFFVSDQGHIASNAHVIGFCRKVKVYEDGEEIFLDILATDMANDIGLVKGQFRNSQYLNIKVNGAELGEDIVAFGYPLVDKLSDSVKLTKGIVSALSGPHNNTALIQIDAALQPGNSGGPVLNMSGQVVGIASSGLAKLKMAKEQQVLPENVNFAVAAPTIASFLKANKINVSSGTSEIYSTKELAKIGEPRTVQILCMNTMKFYEEILEKKTHNEMLLDLK